MYRVAAIQMASGPNLNANLNETARLINEAVSMGADMISLPENFALMAMRPADNFPISEKYGDGPIQNFLSQQSSRHGIWLVGGTIPMVTDQPNKMRAACLVFDSSGNCVGRYDKIHLFDVNIIPSEQHRESEFIQPGQDVIVMDTPFGRLGLAICYDLRFPELFRCMIDQGVEIINLSSAFTAATGKVHWEMLVRARAIENLSYMIASNQGGYHVNGRETHGHSMIVDPWGSVVTRLQRGTGVICADLNREYQNELRRSFPVLTHRKI